MLSKAAVLVALVARLTTAFVVPEGLSDGAHVVETDEHGNHTFRHLGDFGSSSHHTSAKMSRRAALPAGELGCSSYGIAYSDLAGAQSQLYNYCQSSAPETNARMIWTYKTAFAYSCHYGAGANTCAAGEAQAAFAILSTNCGNPSSPLGGWYWLADWAKNYGYDEVGVAVCTNL